MASNYPTSIDSFNDPLSNSPLNNPSHAAQHQDVNDAVEKLETKLGVGSSPASSATNGQLLVKGATNTTWQPITSVSSGAAANNAVLTADGVGGVTWSALAVGIVAVTSGGTNGRGYRTGLAAQTVNAGVTADVTNSSMTFTGVAGRLYRYQCIAYGASTSASGLASLNVTDGSNNTLFIGWANLSNSSGVGVFVASYVFTATGSTTVKLRLNSVTGNNTIFNASSLGAITLEDIGLS